MPKSKTIMMVEDCNVICEFYKIYISRMGYDLLRAENGWKALDLLKEHTPELILLDMDMQDMDGPMFLRYFSCSAVSKSVPVIIASSRTKAEIDDTTIRLASGYLQKPFGPIALRNVMTEAFKTRAEA